MSVVSFIAGLIVGTVAGFFVAALCVTASTSDRRRDDLDEVTTSPPPGRDHIRVVGGNEAGGAGPARTPGTSRPRTGPHAAPVPPDDPAS